jgi:phosphoribosylamine--glycine ligase
VAIKLDSQIPDVNTYVCETFSKSRQLIEQMFLNNHKRVIIEEYEHGKDITISIVTDGYDAVPLPMSVSYLNALDSDGGQITNGVGAYAPCNCLSLEQESEIANNIVFPVLDAMNAEHMSYTGILTSE